MAVTQHSLPASYRRLVQQHDLAFLHACIFTNSMLLSWNGWATSTHLQLLLAGDEAAEALEQNSTVVLKACQNLEVSLQLLRKHKMAPQLQQQIMQTLEVSMRASSQAYRALTVRYILTKLTLCVPQYPFPTSADVLVCRITALATVWSFSLYH